MEAYDCIVIGGGISGLSVAYGLHRRGCQVLVVEAQSRAGGSIRSERTGDGFGLENGPNTVVSSDPAMDEHFAELGMSDELLVASRHGARRYILVDGQLELIPMSPPTFLRSRVLSPLAKVRLMMEPLIPRSPMADETVRAFFTRRLGAEPAQKLIDPFVSGVYAGDPNALSVRSTFPSIWEAEQGYGSVVRGMIALAGRKRRATKAASTAPKRKRSQMISFQNGLVSWPEAMVRAIGEQHVWLSSSATELKPTEPGWHMSVVREGQTRQVQANRVVLAVPAHTAADLIMSLDTATADALRRIPYPPLAVVHLGYRREDVEHPLDGFGMLCPSGEQRDILGTLWPSALFEGRTPEGTVLTTSYIGGARRPELAQQDEEQLIETAIREQQALVGARGEPVLARAVRWSKAIPQYVAGHHDIVAAMNRLEAMWSGLYLTGNYRDGVSVEKCWLKGQELAQRIPVE
ncbi:MAG: protoporphyrinogen oxidase [Chloroflexaceae bacterium]|nr:protoporphyrinogen oxidase [Chloroflexaceae bacterium]